MNTQETVETLNAFESKGAFAFVAETTKEALKKSRRTKLPTPENLTVVTTLRACTVSLGNDYQAAVNRRLVSEGSEATFKAKGTYCEPVAENRLVYQHKTSGQLYLRVYPNLCHSFKSVVRRFDKNGVEISAEQWAEIEAEYFDKPSENKSQGLENPILVNNYKLENVKFLKRGEILIDELTAALVKRIAA